MKRFLFSLWIICFSCISAFAQVDVDDINKKLSRIDFFGDLPSGWKYKYDPDNFSLYMGSYQYTVQDPQGNKYKIYISPKLENVFNIPELSEAAIGTVEGPTGNYSPYQSSTSTGVIAKYIHFAHRFFDNTGVKIDVNVDVSDHSSDVSSNIKYLAKHIDDKLLYLIQAENIEHSMYELIAPLLAGMIALAGLGGIGASMGAFANIGGLLNLVSPHTKTDSLKSKSQEESKDFQSSEIDSIKNLADKCYSKGAGIVESSKAFINGLHTELAKINKDISRVDDEIRQINANNPDVILNPRYWELYDSCNKTSINSSIHWHEMNRKYSSFWHSGFEGEKREKEFSFLDNPNTVIKGMEKTIDYKNSLIDSLKEKLSNTEDLLPIEEINSEIKKYNDEIDNILDAKMSYKNDLNKLKEHNSIKNNLQQQLDSIIKKHKSAERDIQEIKSNAGYSELLSKQKEIEKQINSLNKSKAQNEADWLQDVKQDYENRLVKLNDFIKKNSPQSKNYESDLVDLIIDLQKAQKRICQAVDYQGIVNDETQKETKYNPPYESYEDDVQDLTFARENLHKFEKDLKSYQTTYKPGDPGYSKDIIDNMKKDIEYWNKRANEVANTIKNNNGKIPKDNYVDSGLSPYGGVGKDVASEMKNLNDFRAYQDNLSRKVENFLNSHPEYGRLRDNLYDENGYVNKDLASRMMEHHQRNMNNVSNLDVINSDAYYLSLFAHNTSKELFTGLKSDGTTSYLAAGFKTLVNISTGGTSEIFLETANAFYQMSDSAMQGKTTWQSFSGAVSNLLFDEMTSNLLQKPTLMLGDAIQKTFPKTTNTIMNFLQKDVKDVLGGNNIKPSPVSSNALAAKNTMKNALKSGNEDDLLNLYKSNGMKNLAELEANGHITIEEAKQLNDFITKQANESINKGTISTIDDFQRSNNIKIKEVLVGDSGSSAKGGGIRSVKTDADRTTLVVFDKDSLEKYAYRNNISVEEAYENLSHKFASSHDSHVSDHLARKGLTNNDIDFGTYDRIMKGHSGGPADTYPTGFTAARQSISGTTTVYTTDELGNLKSTYKTSGDALVDQNILMKTDYGTKGVLEDPLKISSEELKPLFEQQKIAINKYTDPKSVAKGLNRANYCTGRTGDIFPDPKLMSVATQIAKNPQKINEILQSNGYSIKSFVNQSKNIMQNFSPNFG